MAARTYLFVPGDNRRMLSKAHLRGAGAVIADLEDAVAAGGKEAARSMVARWLDEVGGVGVELWVRVNPGELLEADVAALSARAVTGVVVPKVTGPRDVGAAVAALERAALDKAGIIPMVEAAAALASIHEIVAAPRIHQLMLGDMDLGAELGMAPTSPGWTSIRVQLVVASAAAGLVGPIGPVDPDFTDLDRIAAETRELYELGFRSRPAIHPAQLPPMERALAPTDAEVGWARGIVALLDETTGVAVDEAGRMIDEAVAKRARRILDEAAPEASFEA